jgi:hypothetical protein
LSGGFPFLATFIQERTNHTSITNYVDNELHAVHV